MSYTSPELTHFVGRGLRTPESQFTLLCDIVREGLLIDISHLGRSDRIFFAGARNMDTGEIEGGDFSSLPNVRHVPGTRLSSNDLVQFEVVCFCDIPMAELGRHCRNYSQFGLAFSKQFLLTQGASPVMYVPRSSRFAMMIQEHRVPTRSLEYQEHKSGDRATLFDELFDFHNHLGLLRYEQIKHAMFTPGSTAPVDQLLKELRSSLLYQTGVEAAIFGFLKFFDPELPDEHLDNYYMEREWRISGHLHFEPSDIAYLLVPEDFVGRAQDELPALKDRVTALLAT